MNRGIRIALAIIVIGITVSSGYAVARYILFPQQAVPQPLTCSAGALPLTSQVEPSQTQTLLQQTQASPSLPLQVVAGENFWGSLISQLGGNRTSVLSIVTDPNADPHDYESNSANAVAIADANLVIINGAGYDNWATNLINANPNPNRVVLNVASLLGKGEGDNPHFWYGPAYVNETVHQMFEDLVNIDNLGSSYYVQQYATLNASLSGYNGQINEIRRQFSGVRVASTESIFQYLAAAANLDLISPYPFMQAVAEGNDPSPGCIAVFQSQILSPTSPGNATVLVYNAQTVTPITQQLKAEAAQHNIPIVAVTETVQPNSFKFQDWMSAELVSLYYALNANALGH